jgi:flavin-dependent dehydrogenase
MVPRTQYPYNLCVRRDVLDAILLERAAVESTVELRTGCRVRGLVRENDRVVGVTGDGWEDKAQVVIGADGRNSPTARLAGAGVEFDGGAVRCTVHAYWSDVVALPQPALELWRSGDQTIQMGPCDRDWVIMVSLPQSHLLRMRAEGDQGYIRRLLDIPAMRARLRHATIASPVYRCGALRNFVRTAAGPGWRLVGDAVAHKDPLMGAGIADAVAGAQVLAETVHDALSGRTGWTDAETAYRAAIDRRSGQRLPKDLADLPVQPARDDQLAWIRGVLGHPAFAIELGQRCAELFSGLPPERRRYWQQVADDTARLLALPAPARIVE